MGTHGRSVSKRLACPYKLLLISAPQISQFNAPKPYISLSDLLFAIAQALINIKNSNGEGVFLALTTKKAGGNRIGWEDRAPASQIKQRVSVILKGMEKLSDAEVQTLIDEKFRIKRVLEDDGKNYLHTKVVCVDRNMMYVGSDNAYPNYNEEHGIWIEDRPTVDTWFKDFWDELWRRSSEVDTEKF